MKFKADYIFYKPSKYFVIAAIAVLGALATHSQATAATSAKLGGFISPATIILLFIGIVISVFYLKAMLTVLNEAADSYTEVEEDNDGSYYAAPAWGAALAGLIAAIVIWSYSVHATLLYIGPVLSMLSPVAILYCMFQDIKNFKQLHRKTNSEEKKTVAKLTKR